MNSFTSDKAPYILTIIISVLGWLINGAILELREQILISYDQTLVRLDDEGSYLRVELRNDSISHVMRDITIELKCDRGTFCLSGKEKALDGNLVSPVIRPPWFFNLGIESGVSQEEAEALTLTPIVPAGSALSFVVGIKDPERLPTLLFVLPAEAEVSPTITQGFSLAGWMTQRYLQLLVIFSAIALLALLLFGMWAMSRQSNAPRPPDNRRHN